MMSAHRWKMIHNRNCLKNSIRIERTESNAVLAHVPHRYSPLTKKYLTCYLQPN